ncbi:MAG: transglutaminase-like domain-containing protein, partial [Terrimicrobiaceae bacterium]|nr:transglutaminase-like domain-containing protein [Terrimicrobiaceae bacterium]
HIHSDEYYFKVESLAYYPIVLGGVQNYLPNAGVITGNTLTAAAPSTLYAINFDQKPTWRATDVDKPQFQGEPMPPEYLGKSLDELLHAQSAVTQTVTGAPGSFTTLDESPELRRHPVLDDLVASLIGNLPTPEQKAIALANFVQNEIALSDPINYNESGEVSEASINPGGVNRGALATYLEGQGSPVEKAALLVYMLRQAGIPAAYMFPEKNKLKMLDIRMSSILKFQIKGAVNNLGQTQAPYDPAEPALIPVNYPWVAASIDNQWTHFFPWINDTEVVEGYNLYDYMPEGYKNAHQWIDKYLNGDTAILSLGTGTETKSPGVLFQKFIKAKLAENHPTISFDEIGIRYRDRKNYYSRLEDFPKPFELTGTPETVAALSSKTDIFDTITIKIYSLQDPAKKIETAELPVVDFHNRRLLLRQTKVDAATHQFSLTLAPFRPGTTGTGAFTNSFSSLALKQTVNGSANLVGTDQQLGIEISVKRNKRYFNNFTAPTDRWNTFLGYSSGSSYGTTLSINKGDLAAICLSVGKVSSRMMEEQAKEFWQMESAATGSPATQDPDIYQGTAAYLMGMSYYNKLDSFTGTNANLHKRLLVGNLSMGLAVLKAKYEGGVLPNGDITYVQPFVDMFYQDIGMVGNETAHADSGIENIAAKKDFEALNITAGSAFEHEAIDTYFNMGDSISTVELLRTAKSNPALYPDAFYELTINNYLTYDAAMAAYDAGLWTQVKGYFETPGFGKYVKAYITSKPVVGASGAYTGMGALIFGPNQWGALISKNLSGGAGRYFSNPASFESINVPNIKLSYNFSSAQPAYSLSTIAPSVAAPAFTSSLAPSWNYNSSFDSISTGASLVSSVNTNSWALSASSLGFTPSGSGSVLAANLYSLNYATGSAGTPSFFGSVKSAVNAISSFVSDPVSVVTGEFYIDTVDLRLEGPMPLEIRRNYSSQNLAHNNFGHGWRWAYFPYLVVGQNADIIQAADADGSVVVFRKQSATEWKPVAADNPTLANLQGDSFGSTANLFNSKIVLTTSGD